MRSLFVKKLRLVSVLFVLMTGFSTSLPAFGKAEQTNVQAELIAEAKTIQPDKTFQVAIKLALKDGWHIYWKNPGDTGMAPQIDWSLPEGFTIKRVDWPYPEKYEKDSVVTFGYEKEAVLIAHITAPKTLAAGSKSDIKAAINFVACSKDTCMPGTAIAELSVSFNESAPERLSEAQPIFRKARHKIPSRQMPSWVHKKSNGLELYLQPEGSRYDTAIFFPEGKQRIQVSQNNPLTKNPDYIVLSLDNASETLPERLKGVVVLKKGSDVHSYEIDLPVKGEQSGESISSFGLALALAFLGGMILNLMPCVLPVVSFKVLSFIKIAQESRKKIFQHGLAFSGGVLLSFWVLAGFMIGLQSYGRSVGWGFQLQEPIFVAILAAIIFVFALSLFGLFEFGAAFATWAGQKQHKNKSEGLAASFFSGILATAVATPCTGPFLGTAVGFAVTQPAFLSLLIFSSLGFGMAFPYLILCGFPKLLRFLPKPGNWMVVFKEVLGFVMLATVLWLMWVFAAQTGTFAVFLLLAGFFLLSVGCWIYGKWGSPIKKKKTRLISYILSLVCLAGGIYTIVDASYMDALDYDVEKDVVLAMADPRESIEKWHPFSPEKIEKLRKKGTPVFVDFTAKWCLICQTNHLVLSSSKVEKKMAELGIVKMKADWTKRNPMITEELRKFGRNGVPLYLLYSPNSDEPKILPQVLTPEGVMQYLNELENKNA